MWQPLLTFFCYAERSFCKALDICQEMTENKKPAFNNEDGKKMCPGKDSPPDRGHSGREPSHPCERR